MATSAEQLINEISGTAAKATDAIAEAAAQAKEWASQVGRGAAEKVDETRAFTADTLHDTAKSIRQYGAKAAEELETGAKYVRAHDFRGMAADMVRRSPGLSLIAALAAGFVMGSALGGRKA